MWYSRDNPSGQSGVHLQSTWRCAFFCCGQRWWEWAHNLDGSSGVHDEQWFSKIWRNVFSWTCHFQVEQKLAVCDLFHLFSIPLRLFFWLFDRFWINPPRLTSRLAFSSNPSLCEYPSIHPPEILKKYVPKYIEFDWNLDRVLSTYIQKWLAPVLNLDLDLRLQINLDHTF